MTRFNTLIAAVVIWAAATPLAMASFQITPFLSCVDVNPDTTITAYFGYESFEKAIVQVAVGADNRFVPAPADRNQPILFFPGYFAKAFRVTTNSNGLIWIFNGFGIPALSSSTPCTAASLPSGTTLVPYTQKLSAIGASGGLSWTAVGDLPPGLGLSSDGVLSGTPTTAGAYALTVNVVDATKTSTSRYLLTITNGLGISDALSTRPAGFEPRFRTVSQVGASNTAVASCDDATEFVITGGGGCVVPNQNTIQGRMASSQASGNGWAITCSGGTATAVAVCSRKQ